MADNESVHGLKPPKQLLINNEENMKEVWKTWVQQYQWFETATGLKKKDPEIQVATLMSIIGGDAVKIFNTFNLSEVDAKNVEKIKQKFQEYFVPKINITYERYIFNKVVQKQNETFDEFLTNLRQKCKNVHLEI